MEFEITDNSAEVLAAFQEACIRGLEKCGLAGEGYAKKNLTENGSVDTGALRNSNYTRGRRRRASGLYRVGPRIRSVCGIGNRRLLLRWQTHAVGIPGCKRELAYDTRTESAAVP